MWVKTLSKLSAAKKKIMNVLFQNEIPLDLGVPVFLIVDEDFLPPLNDLNDGLHRLQLFWVPSFELLETRRD